LTPAALITSVCSPTGGPSISSLPASAWRARVSTPSSRDVNPASCTCVVSCRSEQRLATTSGFFLLLQRPNASPLAPRRRPTRVTPSSLRILLSLSFQTTPDRDSGPSCRKELAKPLDQRYSNLLIYNNFHMNNRTNTEAPCAWLSEGAEAWDLIRTWQACGFTLRLFDTGRSDHDGKQILGYELFDEEHGDATVFADADFHCSPLHSIDSDRTVGSLLTFLSLRPGDTDPEHFEHYTASQLDWCHARAEELALLADELGQPCRQLHAAKIGHKSWNEAHAAGRYNRALTLSFTIDGVNHRVHLKSGESDDIYTLTDGRQAYVISSSFRLQYVGVEVFSDGDCTGDIFIDGSEVEASLGDDVWDLEPAELLERLLPYLPDEHSAPKFTTEAALIEERLGGLNQQVRTQLRTFLRIGRENPWIREANDPPFTALSFHVCADEDELVERLLRGNWCLGQAFVLGEVCFINQVDGGDEWLTIKGRTAFESITMQTHSETRSAAEARLRDTLRRINAASEELCKQLDY